LGHMYVNGPAGRAAQKATQVILLCRHGGEKQTSSNRRDRLYLYAQKFRPYIRIFTCESYSVVNPKNREPRRIYN